MLANKFLIKVADEGTVDTKRYRYKAVSSPYSTAIEIRRILLKDLDTKVALAPWPLVGMVYYRA